MRRKQAGAFVPLILAILAGALAVQRPARIAAQASFAEQIRDLSEPGGSFDTDNLISNERAYLRVIPAIRNRGHAGGAYVGVGPDQNFSYIAASRPAVAFIIDVRRDNLLLHLLFKALFHLSGTRAEYLARLFGRQLTLKPDESGGAPLESLLTELDHARRQDRDVLRKQVAERVQSFGVPLTPDDLATIDRFYATFMDQGISLKFQSTGRPPRSYYPTYQDLLLGTDDEGRQANFLASESDFGFVRSLELRNLIIPVVGNLAGPKAFAAIGRAIAERREVVSVLYVSNVEYYLFQDGLFNQYASTLASWPRDKSSLIVRSVFAGAGSDSITQPLDAFVNDFKTRKYGAYRDLLNAYR